MKKYQFLWIIILLGSNSAAISSPSINHSILGWENLYAKRELAIPPYSTELNPHFPEVGDTVRVGFSTKGFTLDIDPRVHWRKNGIEQEPIHGNYIANHEGECFWEAVLGAFSAEDQISYSISALFGTKLEKVGPFEFPISEWVHLNDVQNVRLSDNILILDCDTEDDSINPKIQISFPSENYFRLNVLLGNDQEANAEKNVPIMMKESDDYVEVRTIKYALKISKHPFRWTFTKLTDQQIIVRNDDHDQYGSIAFLKNRDDEIIKIQENIYTEETESFYGFGMRYNHLDKRFDNVDIHVTNTAYEQEEKTYIPIPFYLNSGGYGFYLNSTAYSQFRLATDADDRCTILTDTRTKTGSVLEYYVFGGEDSKAILSSYSSAISKPVLPPIWAFGLWISANEWNRQSEIENQIALASQFNIPISVLVLEAWSDEETFYIFNDAQYSQKPASEAYSLDDFQFTGRWPNPVSMVQKVHESNMKILLWNIPVLKYSLEDNPQRDLDEAQAVKQGYVVKTKDHEPYRMPRAWFGNSLLFDFTNPEANKWWFSKRKYLINQLGIDGFKTDGGEFAYGSGIQFHDGRSGVEMHNAYPDVYNQAYYDYLKTLKNETVVFGRAGGTTTAQHPLTWNGDQRSTFSEFRAAIRSVLSAGISGIPFVAWDMAGFAHDQMPSVELYKRSVAATTFSSIMQLHSETSGDPVPSRARTPWNMAEVTGDSSCIDVFRKFINIRMNLLPYIYSEANFSVKTGLPMMRQLALEFPDDNKAAAESYEYLLGSNLLVAPVVHEGHEYRDIYLPAGDWTDFWSHDKIKGPTDIRYEVNFDQIPVFAKSGSIIPMNLSDDYVLGNYVGNDIAKYKRLTFRIYPAKNTEYLWLDYRTAKNTMKHISVNETKKHVNITLPDIPDQITLQIINRNAKKILYGDSKLKKATSWSQFLDLPEGWYFDKFQTLLYVKVREADRVGDVKILLK